MQNKLTKEDVRQARVEFFADVVEALCSQPKPIDEKLEQVKYYHSPVEGSLISDADFGDFYIEINPVFSGRMWPLAYSIWQTGQELRVAIIVHSVTEDARWADPEEFSDLWGGVEMRIMQRGAKQFLEWRFEVTDFHSNYAVREKFVLGMRHLHFRTLKAIRGLGPKGSVPGLPAVGIA